MPSECPPWVNGEGGKDWWDIVSISGDLVFFFSPSDQKQCFSGDAGKETVIRPNPRLLVSMFNCDFITRTRQSRRSVLYERHNAGRLKNKTFQADVWNRFWPRRSGTSPPSVSMFRKKKRSKKSNPALIWSPSTNQNKRLAAERLQRLMIVTSEVNRSH